MRQRLNVQIGDFAHFSYFFVNCPLLSQSAPIPGISKLNSNRNSRSSHNHGSYNRRNLLNLKKGQANQQTLLQQIDAYRQDKKFAMYKDISLLSLRNENFNLPFPEPASSARQLVGINESLENYSQCEKMVITLTIIKNMPRPS